MVTVFWKLILAHLLGDFTFQTDYVNRLKRSGRKGLLLHCFIHAAAVFFLLLPDLPIKNIIPLSVIIGAVHYMIDALRVLLIKKGFIKDSLPFFIADQALHIAFICLLCAGILHWIFYPLKVKWPELLCLFVCVTHFCGVLVYYTEKIFRDAVFPSGSDKYYLMTLRTVLWAFFLMPGYAFWIPCAFVWGGLFFFYRKIGLLDISYINLAFSLAVPAFAGMLGRLVIYRGF